MLIRAHWCQLLLFFWTGHCDYLLEVCEGCHTCSVIISWAVLYYRCGENYNITPIANFAIWWYRWSFLSSTVFTGTKSYNSRIQYVSFLIVISSGMGLDIAVWRLWNLFTFLRIETLVRDKNAMVGKKQHVQWFKTFSIYPVRILWKY